MIIYIVLQPVIKPGLMNIMKRVFFSLLFIQFLAKNSGAQDIFGICLGESSGILSLGGIDKSLYVGSIYWVDVQSPSFYSLRLRGFHIGEYSISIVFHSSFIHSCIASYNFYY